MLPFWITRTSSPALMGRPPSPPSPPALVWPQVEKFSRRLPSTTSRAASHEAGAMRVNHGQLVWLLWQSKQARTARARVWGLSHGGSATTGGLVYDTPVGTSWSRPNKMRPATTTIPTPVSSSLDFIQKGSVSHQG